MSLPDAAPTPKTDGAGVVWTVRIAIFALLLLNGAITLDDASSTRDLTEQLVENARIGERLDSHLATHPDAGLGRRIDRLQREVDELEERLRRVERDHSDFRGE